MIILMVPRIRDHRARSRPSAETPALCKNLLRVRWKCHVVFICRLLLSRLLSLGSATTIAFDCWAQTSASAVVVAARACSPSLRLDVGFPDDRPPLPDLG